MSMAVSKRQFVKFLKAQGFEWEAKKVKRRGGHNCKFVHKDGRYLRVPGQHGAEFKTGTLHAMLEQAGLDHFSEQDILDA